MSSTLNFNSPLTWVGNFSHIYLCFTTMFRSEVGILTSTAHLAKFVKMTSSPQLLNEFVYFILGDNTSPEKPGDADHKIRHRLIERCDHLSDEANNLSI